MNPQDPLAQLKDIHLPEPVSWWPLAWGWWLLIGLLLVLSVTGLWLWLRHRRRNRYRHQALAKLEQAYQAYLETGDTAGYLQNLNQLLRRALLSAWPAPENQRLTTLSGEHWLAFLDASLPGKTNDFSQGVGRALLAGPYQPQPQADVEALHKLGQEWLKHHRRDRSSESSWSGEPHHA